MLKRLFIRCIRLYQNVISPLLGPRCRYYPTCSQYAILSLEKYGLWKGTKKAIWRVLRCNPFSDGGVDYP